MPPTAGQEMNPPLPPSSVTEEPTALARAIAARDNLAKIEESLAREQGLNQIGPRLITDHKLNGLNDAIQVAVIDEPGVGGGNHVYQIDIVGLSTVIGFQNGPIGEAGVNGISNESLLAVVIDRMRGFQHGRNPDGSFDFNARGKFACRENALALTDLESALMWLQKRTRDRLARGVEGQNKL